MTDNLVERAWAAGFFDGEGYVGAHWHKRRTNTGSRAFQVEIVQIDRATLDRFQRAVGVGWVSGPYVPRNPRHKAQFKYHASGLTAATAVLQAIGPHLSAVKLGQFQRAVEKYHDPSLRSPSLRAYNFQKGAA